MHSYPSTFSHAHTHTYTHLHTLKPTHTHTYTHSHLHTLTPTHTHTPSPGTVSDDMADAIVNFKQSTEYKCDKLGYLSAPVGKVRTLDEMCLGRDG